MKRHFLPTLALITALALLPACKHNDVATATAVATDVSTQVGALPPALVLKLQSLAAKHPAVSKDLAAIATALNVVSVDVSKLPTPATLSQYLLWVDYIPELGTYSQEFLALYTEFFPALTASNDALAKIAAVIQATGAK